MKYSLAKKQNLLVLLLFVIGVAASAYYLQKPEPLNTDEEISVQETVLRHLFKNNASSSQQNVAYYFVEISGSDPAKKLISKFEGHNPRVLPESQASLSNDLIREVHHKSDGKQGLIFRIRKIAPRQDGKIYVEAQYFEASLSAGNYQYLLKFKNNSWQIISEEYTLGS